MESGSFPSRNQSKGEKSSHRSKNYTQNLQLGTTSNSNFLANKGMNSSSQIQQAFLAHMKLPGVNESIMKGIGGLNNTNVAYIHHNNKFNNGVNPSASVKIEENAKMSPAKAIAMKYASSQHFRNPTSPMHSQVNSNLLKKDLYVQGMYPSPVRQYNNNTSIASVGKGNSISHSKSTVNQNASSKQYSFAASTGVGNGNNKVEILHLHVVKLPKNSHFNGFTLGDTVLDIAVGNPPAYAETIRTYPNQILLWKMSPTGGSQEREHALSMLKNNIWKNFLESLTSGSNVSENIDMSSSEGFITDSAETQHLIDFKFPVSTLSSQVPTSTIISHPVVVPARISSASLQNMIPGKKSVAQMKNIYGGNPQLEQRTRNILHSNGISSDILVDVGNNGNKDKETTMRLPFSHMSGLQGRADKALLSSDGIPSDTDSISFSRRNSDPLTKKSTAKFDYKNLKDNITDAMNGSKISGKYQNLSSPIDSKHSDTASENQFADFSNNLPFSAANLDDKRLQSEILAKTVKNKINAIKAKRAAYQSHYETEDVMSPIKRERVQASVPSTRKKTKLVSSDTSIFEVYKEILTRPLDGTNNLKIENSDTILPDSLDEAIAKCVGIESADWEKTEALLNSIPENTLPAMMNVLTDAIQLQKKKKRSEATEKAKSKPKSKLSKLKPRKDHPEEWVQCDNCGRWRILPDSDSPEYPTALADKWICTMNTWNPEAASCNVDEHSSISASQALRSKRLKVWVRRLKSADRYEAKHSRVHLGRKPGEVDWIRCCNPTCRKWRACLKSMDAKALKKQYPIWYCWMATWDEPKSSCDAPQEGFAVGGLDPSQLSEEDDDEDDEEESVEGKSVSGIDEDETYFQGVSSRGRIVRTRYSSLKRTNNKR